MNYWSRVKVRHKVLLELRRRIYIEEARLKACNIELIKIGYMQYPAYRIMWSRMLDHCQELLTLQHNIKGCNLFWVLTGKRWLVWPYLMYALRRIERFFEE